MHNKLKKKINGCDDTNCHRLQTKEKNNRKCFFRVRDIRDDRSKCVFTKFMQSFFTAQKATKLSNRSQFFTFFPLFPITALLPKNTIKKV